VPVVLTDEKRRKTMKKMLLLGVLFCAGCAIPYTKLSDELSVKQLVWPSGRFYYRMDTRLKNTSDNLLDLKVVCNISGEENIYNIKILPGEEKGIVEKVSSPLYGGVSASCNYFKR
jgi:hypothetical protein